MAKHFNVIYRKLRIKQPLISSWLKEEAIWHAHYKKEGGVAGLGLMKHLLQTQYPEVDKMLDLFLNMALLINLLFMHEIIHQKWQLFANCCSIPADKQLSLSNGWLDCFKK